MQYEVKPAYALFLFLIDLVGGLFFFWTKCFSIPQNPKKILVIRLDHAGDMLMTTPVFRALKAKFPNTEVCTLCRSFVSSVIESNPNVDKIFTLEAPWFKRYSSVSWLSALNFLLKLRKEKFDIVIELHGDPRNIIAAFLIGGYRLGYSTRGFGFLLNKIVEYAPKAHNIDKNINVIRAINADSDNKMEMFLNKKDIVASEKFLSSHKLKKYFLFYPAAGKPEKYWAPDNWARLTEKIIVKYKTDIVFGGSVNDAEYVDSMIAKVPKKIHRRIHNACLFIDNFGKIGALIKKSSLVISVDTVAVHLAAAFDVPLVALYGHTDPLIWGYSGKNIVSIYKTLSDSCGNDCRKESHRNQMLQKINTKDVLNTVEKLL